MIVDVERGMLPELFADDEIIVQKPERDEKSFLLCTYSVKNEQTTNRRYKCV
jgi:hypothetical protein